MSTPLVTVITVVYNGAATLEDTIRSVAGQTFRDREYIIVDGGSTDATHEIIKRYAGTAVTRWISEPDKGVYDAMNKGIRIAEGDWVYFLGSDDLFHDPEVLGRLFSDPAVAAFDLVYGDVVSPSYKWRYDGEFSLEKLLSRNISHQAAFYKRNLFLRLGEFNLRYKMHADWDFNLRCFNDPAVRTKYTDVLVATFGADGLSAGHDLLFLRERLIPAKLELLYRAGEGSLRRLSLYDEWWRFLRNAGFRDKTLPAPSFPVDLQRMLRWQRSFPAGLIKKGVFSKPLMFASYLVSYLTATQ